MLQCRATSLLYYCFTSNPIEATLVYKLFFLQVVLTLTHHLFSQLTVVLYRLQYRLSATYVVIWICLQQFLSCLRALKVRGGGGLPFPYSQSETRTQITLTVR